MHPLELILGDHNAFLDRIFAALAQDQLSVDDYELDHVCYRVEHIADYQSIRADLAQHGQLLSEAVIGGRPIASFLLHEPLVYQHRIIPMVELPSPKPGRPYARGYEHAEFVIPDSFADFMQRYPQLTFDTRSAHKGVNPEISRDYEGMAVKFHHHTLEYVIRFLD